MLRCTPAPDPRADPGSIFYETQKSSHGETCPVGGNWNQYTTYLEFKQSLTMYVSTLLDDFTMENIQAQSFYHQRLAEPSVTERHEEKGDSYWRLSTDSVPSTSTVVTVFGANNC
jgi:hypothetical protein